MISDELIGRDEDLPNKNTLFQKVNCIIKNLSVDDKGYPLRKMSFRNLVLSEFQEHWEDSNWKNYFEEVTVLLLNYLGDKHFKNGSLVLQGVNKVTFNVYDVEAFSKTYKQVQKCIAQHDVNLLPKPKCFSNQILEVSTKGKKRVNSYATFFMKDITKVCFVFDNAFLFHKMTKPNIVFENVENSFVSERKLWTKEEMLLTLYIYLTHNSEDLYKSSKFLQNFCERLNQYTGKSRTVSSIEMRICNYKAVDPNYDKIGLNNGGKNVLRYWMQYSDKLDYLQEMYQKFVNSTFAFAKEENIKEFQRELKNTSNQKK